MIRQNYRWQLANRRDCGCHSVPIFPVCVYRRKSVSKRLCLRRIRACSRLTPTRISFPPTRVFRFEPSTFELGLTHVEAAPGEPVRIYDPARTVVDLMRLRHRLGAPTALGALQRYLRRGDASPAELLKIAADLRVYGPVLQALDVASAG